MPPPHLPSSLFFFFNDTATTEIYTLSLHDALPISFAGTVWLSCWNISVCRPTPFKVPLKRRSEEHTSELQSQSNLVCRLLLEKKKCRLPLCHQPLAQHHQRTGPAPLAAHRPQ